MRAFYSIALFSILTLISLLIAHVLITKTNPKSVEKAEKYIPLQKPDLEKKKGYIDVCSLRKENMVAAILRYGSAAPTLCYNSNLMEQYLILKTNANQRKTIIIG